MPSPPFPRSISAPDITSPQSPSHPSNNSVRSTRSTGSPITTWPKRLGDLVTRKTKSSDLTQASLEEFNKRNALEARYNSSSPYYKGLIDYTLGLNREKLSGSSPGRESHAASFISTGSKTSFSFKVQEWGSCFTLKRPEKSSSSSSSFWTTSSSDTRKWTSVSSSKTTESGLTVTKIRTKTAKSGSETERKRVVFPQFKTEDTIIPSITEKPLRERNFEASPILLLPLSPPTAPPPESLPYPLPQIIPLTELQHESLPYPPTERSLPSPPPTPLLSAQTPPSTPPPVLESSSSPPSAVQAPPTQSPNAGGVTYENKGAETTTNEIKYIWADKYRPSVLQNFLCNRETALWLQSIARNWNNKAGECGHFIFEGKPGVGKRTMIRALLREAFGKDKLLQAREECKTFHLKGEAVSSILVNLTVSPQHIELNLSDLKGYEKHVIVELIKEKNELINTNPHCGPENCKAVILYEADKLCPDALSYIKWMLEKFKGCNKVFFCCSDASKLQAIKPLCTHVQLLEPSNREIIEVLAFIATQERIELPHQLADKIANNSKNNLRQAIRSFEATWHFNGRSLSLKEDQDIKTGWEDKIAKIATNVIQEQSPKQLYEIRGELQNLIEHNVAPDFIFQTLKEELKKILQKPLQPQFDNLYDEYQQKRNNPPSQLQEEHGKRQHDPRKNDPVQQFMRIEEFIARFMSWYKSLVVKKKEV